MSTGNNNRYLVLLAAALVALGVAYLYYKRTEPIAKDRRSRCLSREDDQGRCGH